MMAVRLRLYDRLRTFAEQGLWVAVPAELPGNKGLNYQADGLTRRFRLTMDTDKIWFVR